MKASHISSLSVSLALRTSLARLQNDLPRLQTEVVTGKHSDTGLALGAESRKLAAFKNDISHIERLIDTNAQVGTRLAMSQESMGRLNDLASELMNSVAIVMGQEGQDFAAKLTSDSVMEEMTSILNTQVNGVFLFGGVNASDKPIADYPGGPMDAAFDAAFVGYFGFTQNDPAAAAISKTDIETFLSTTIEPMFMGADWGLNLSSATDETQTARISPEVSTSASVSANEDAFRRLMMAAVVGAEFFESGLGGEAMQGASEFVIAQAGASAGALTELQGEVGLVEERVRRANDRLEVQMTLLETFAAEMESVDSFEASIELNTLLTQIETSYSITARIQQLSIMNYV